MEKLPKMISMARTPAEIAEDSEPCPAPIYPYGLNISLCEEELEKLGLDDDCEVGDMLHMHCMLRVTAVRKQDTEAGKSVRVEMQITDIAEESEDEENEEEERRMPLSTRMYKD